MGWPVLGYLLGKNYRRRDRDRLVPLRWMDAAVSVPRCVILLVGSVLAAFSECALVRRLRFRHRLPQRQVSFRPAVSAVRVPDDVGISHGKDSFCCIP